MLAAADHQAGSESRRALEELARAYWFPLYAFVRRQGESAPAAEDMVQEFFARLLEKRYLAQIDRSKGTFRSFLLAAMKHFISNERGRGRAKKRGGGQTLISLDGLAAEARYAVEPADDMTPERVFERRWALTVLDMVLSRLSAEYAQAGKAGLYQAIQPCLSQGAGAIDYGQVSRELGMSARRRPPRRVMGYFGSNGSMRFHCSSVSSIFLLAMSDSFRQPDNHKAQQGASLYFQRF